LGIQGIGFNEFFDFARNLVCVFLCDILLGLGIKCFGSKWTFSQMVASSYIEIAQQQTEQIQKVCKHSIFGVAY